MTTDAGPSLEDAEHLVRGTIVAFLDSINPAVLEAQALQHVTGLEGEHTVGSAFLHVLKGLASGD